MMVATTMVDDGDILWMMVHDGESIFGISLWLPWIPPTVTQGSDTSFLANN